MKVVALKQISDSISASLGQVHAAGVSTSLLKNSLGLLEAEIKVQEKIELAEAEKEAAKAEKEAGGSGPAKAGDKK